MNARPWTAVEEDLALVIMRQGGTVEEIAEVLPHRTRRAVGIKAKRLQRVVDREAKARTIAAERSDADLWAEWQAWRGDKKGRDAVTEEVLQQAAYAIGIPLDRMRDVFLRGIGVIE